jgi:predicted aspartyl protease
MKKPSAFAKLLTALSSLTLTIGFNTSPAAAQTLVKFRLVHDLPVVEVMVNGHGPFDFIFDTGSTTTVVDLELSKRLGLVKIGESTIGTAASSKPVACVRLDALSVGPYSVRNLMVLSTNLQFKREIAPSVQGVLGQTVISGVNYILNYRHRRIEFEPVGELGNNSWGARIPVERDRGTAVIVTPPSSPRGRALKWILDSAAHRPVIFDSVAARSTLKVELDGERIRLLTCNGPVAVFAGKLRKLRIGDQEFENLAVGVVDSNGADYGVPKHSLLPTNLFSSIYFNNVDNYVILNARRSNTR